MPLLVAILLGFSAVMIVLYPLFGFGREPGTSETLPPSEVAERERAAREALREVEFDYRLGNLDAADYGALRDRYERRALSALKSRYQREQELDALIERQLEGIRTERAERSNVAPSAAAATTPAEVAPASAASKSSQSGHKPSRGPQARRRGRV